MTEAAVSFGTSGTLLSGMSPEATASVQGFGHPWVHPLENWQVMWVNTVLQGLDLCSSYVYGSVVLQMHPLWK